MNYKLYHDKEKSELIISPIDNLLCDESKITNELLYFNDNYIVCSDRKALKEKAKDIKEEWITEAYDNWKMIQNIKIVDKYYIKKLDKIV